MELGKINNYIDNRYDVGTDSKFNTLLKNSIDGESFEKRLKHAEGGQDEKELKKVCQEFEAIMLNIMYKQMKLSVPRADLIPKSTGSDVFESMLDESLVEEVSKSGRFGLADALYKQLSKT